LKKIDKEIHEFGKESRNLRLVLAIDGMNPFGNLSSKEFPEFGKESRNLRLVLATDGMNPFGNLSSNNFMSCFVSDLQLTSCFMYETQIHDVIYDDLWSKTTWK